MNLVLEYFFMMPFWGRVSVSLFFVFLLWWLLGKKIFWILSIIPFILKYLFLCFHRLIEWPIEFLHRKFGKVFSGLEDGWNCIGSKVNSIIESWYKAWHQTGVFHFGKVFLGYILVVIYIMIPLLFNIETGIFTIGENIYLKMENSCVDWAKENNWYEEKEEFESNANNELNKQEEVEKQENNIQIGDSLEIECIVYGLNTSLLVRDIPSTEGSNTLGKLYNDDIVVWSGEIIFAEVNDERIEPWVKVQMKNGVEGWTRLTYLRPKEYKNIEYCVIKKETIIK